MNGFLAPLPTVSNFLFTAYSLFILGLVVSFICKNADFYSAQSLAIRVLSPYTELTTFPTIGTIPSLAKSCANTSGLVSDLIGLNIQHFLQ